MQSRITSSHDVFLGFNPLSLERSDDALQWFWFTHGQIFIVVAILNSTDSDTGDMGAE